MSEIDTSTSDGSTPAEPAAPAPPSRSDAIATPPGVTVTDTVASSSPGASAARASAPVAAPSLTRRGRLRKWDRPPPPHDWRWYVGNLGKTLIAMGILMFGFVAYQLWGTGIENARAQNKLENEFEELLAATPPVQFDDEFVIVDTPTNDAPATDDAADPDAAADEPALDGSDSGEVPVVDAPAAVPVEDQNIPLLENGEALARIEIPDIGVNDIVVAGIDTGDLKKGPGHFPDTPLPGQLGNAAIAGHRTTYGQPFHNVDKLQIGDDIVVTTLNGEFTYKVTGTQIVSPSDYQVISTSDPTKATITLVSCHPKWTAQQRIIISGELAPPESAPVGEPILNYGRPAEPVSTPDIALPAEDVDGQTTGGQASEGGSVTGNLATGDSVDAGDDVSGSLADPATNAFDQFDSDETTDGIADAFSDGWFSDPAANPHVGFWGLVVSAIAIGAYLLSRRTRRDWIGGLVGFIPFVVALYFFFQNVNRLLPPNL
ncbi:class E sortase [Ilumatobacter coccineus]|uniref:Peptidase C60 family protein n=1 Tax=Ilumatobacter coccineus (strain NBRC 103263 / KCTC 29153 / YM16-304) TaxID=1313172 RepID=A0A6C7E3Q4_ILUCY|nr:class E sortase [Ilumatobacter coccineus]BAN01273.1 peptidase C60 family protein [Ilumatobacter coccineus YM16-304]